MSRDFTVLQQGLADALAANRPDSDTEHVVVALPSYSLGESLLSHYVERIPSLEHRYLASMLVLHRIPQCHAVFVASKHPGEEVLDYYGSLCAPDVRRRFHVLELADPTGRSVAAKLLDREDLLDQLRQLVGGRPAMIEPWNVTEAEVEVATRLGIPIHGTDPALRGLGFKSEGRRVFRAAGVPVPVGVEDVRSVEDVRAAISTIRAASPAATEVIVKLDDSGSGDGNIVLDVRDPALDSLPDWYVRDLAAGGVVEQKVSGVDFTSPSAQVDILPSGEAVVLATHEQVLGGENGQVFLGCRFPAEAAYAEELAAHAGAVGAQLATRGVAGRVAIDFAAVRDTSGVWSVYALEINLRKGGTTHPYTTLRNLVPGRYDGGQWRTDNGDVRCYTATDNLVDPAWTGLPARAAIDAVADAGLHFDAERGTGVVLHMLSGLAIDGRLGLTAIGRDRAEGDDLQAATRDALHLAAGRSGS